MARTVHFLGVSMENLTAATGRAGAEEALSKAQVVLLLRWVLIVATSYLVVFSQPLTQHSAWAALFVAAYFASNLVVSEMLPRFSSAFAFHATIVVLDTAMVSLGLALTGSVSSQFYVVYFVVLFLSALTERLGLVVGAALLISLTQLYTEMCYLGVDSLLTPAHLLRIPFLFVVAMFFGNLVQDAHSQERATGEAQTRTQRLAFLSGISHDLKNPLGVVESLASLLLEGDAGALNAPQMELVQRIQASTRHVISFAFNMIDAARLDTGRWVLQRGPVNMQELVEDAFTLARSAGLLKGLTLRSIIEPNLPPADVDALQIERVVSNILGNAIKFTPPGGTVTITVRRRADSLVLAVRDDGPGIPARDLPGIFEQYRRSTHHGGIPGSGLGLYIVKAIVDAHGGSVRIDSSLGRGTTVTMQLPLFRPHPAPLAPSVPARRWWALRMRSVIGQGNHPIEAAPKP